MESAEGGRDKKDTEELVERILPFEEGWGSTEVPGEGGEERERSTGENEPAGLSTVRRRKRRIAGVIGSTLRLPEQLRKVVA
jgi:hypothetical protein